MKKFTLLLLAGLSVLPGVSQQITISNKSNFYLFYGSASPIGPSDVNHQPALLANMKSGSSIDGTYLHQAFKNLFLGVTTGTASFADWSHHSAHTFDGTTTTMVSSGPVVGVKSLPRPLYTFKSIQWMASVSPLVNSTSTITRVSSSINNTYPDIPLTVKSTRIGMEFRGGAEMLLPNSFGIALSLRYRSVDTRSKIFAEKHFAFLSLQVGVYYRLMKDKRFKYSMR